MALFEIETNAHIMIGWADSHEAAEAIAKRQAPGAIPCFIAHPTSAADSIPPARPAQVFFRLMRGASFGPPIARPAKYAPLSVAQTRNKTQSSGPRPCSRMVMSANCGSIM